jgi:hypothetical protein
MTAAAAAAKVALHRAPPRLCRHSSADGWVARLLEMPIPVYDALFEGAPQAAPADLNPLAPTFRGEVMPAP